MTTAERAEVERNAAALGISPPEFIRRRTFGYRLPDAAAVQQASGPLGVGLQPAGRQPQPDRPPASIRGEHPVRRRKASCKP